ncbi:MAG: ABC transporter permease, partial [Candidatus Omnitrophica bacterium]|nr:ABC transporter permease [Candidatus Omnitrophota bacterium]
MTKNKGLSEFQLALQNFKKNRLACVCVILLGLLYASAIFADFLSPYSYKNEKREYSYCPPT